MLIHLQSLKSPLMLVLGLLLATPTTASAIERQHDRRCGNAAPLPSEGVTQRTWAAADHFTVVGSQRFTLTADAPGLAVVDLATPSDAGSALLRFGCASSIDVGVVWKNARTLVVHFARPGLIDLVVETPIGSMLPHTFRLATTFTAEPQASAPPLEVDIDPPDSCEREAPEWTLGSDAARSSIARIRRHRTGKDVEPWECDVFECKVGHSRGWTFVSLKAFGPPLRLSLFRGDRCERSTRLADAMLGRPNDVLSVPVPPGRWRALVDVLGGDDAAYTIEAKSYALCHPDPTDDHGNTPFCATPLDDGPFVGRLEAAMGDTDDLMLLAVDHLSTVDVEVSDGVLSIEDFEGLRVDATSRCDLDGDRRVTATLSPGLYVIRVEADRPEAFVFQGSLRLRPIG